ncbi:hypothetical protein Mapa_001101 [Marchantia paleacea]|nr:hypothetical protein Mapa_001101 [Marchantia paleacea]
MNQSTGRGAKLNHVFMIGVGQAALMFVCLEHEKHVPMKSSESLWRRLQTSESTDLRS